MWKRLRTNYASLFRNFLYLNSWLVAFDQTMVLVPYLIAAPLLFASRPFHRITLGRLVQLSNSFDKVFSSLSVISENWAGVNEFRSVLIRLGQFERGLYAPEGREGEGEICLPSSSHRSDASSPPASIPSARAVEMVAESEFPREAMVVGTLVDQRNGQNPDREVQV